MSNKKSKYPEDSDGDRNIDYGGIVQDSKFSCFVFFDNEIFLYPFFLKTEMSYVAGTVGAVF